MACFNNSFDSVDASLAMMLVFRRMEFGQSNKNRAAGLSRAAFGKASLTDDGNQAQRHIG
jgi:hypothetical protein